MPVIVARQRFDCGADLLVQMFEERPEQWLTTFLRVACHDGESEGMRAIPELSAPGSEAKQTCVVTVSSPRTSSEGATVFPVKWITIGYQALPRSFSGTLDITASPPGALVTITGTSKGERGRTPDMRRVSSSTAETVVRSLLANLASAVAAAQINPTQTVTGAAR